MPRLFPSRPADCHSGPRPGCDGDGQRGWISWAGHPDYLHQFRADTQFAGRGSGPGGGLDEERHVLAEAY